MSIAARRGFRQSFSAYVAWLIQRDAEGGVTREDAPGRHQGPAEGESSGGLRAAKTAKRFSEGPRRGGKLK